MQPAGLCNLAAAAAASSGRDAPTSDATFVLALALRDESLKSLRANEEHRTHIRKLLAAVPWRTSVYAKLAQWLLAELEVHDCRWRWMAKMVHDRNASTGQSHGRPLAPQGVACAESADMEAQRDLIPLVGVILSAALAHEDVGLHRWSEQVRKIYEGSDALCKELLNKKC